MLALLEISEMSPACEILANNGVGLQSLKLRYIERSTASHRPDSPARASQRPDGSRLITLETNINTEVDAFDER